MTKQYKVGIYCRLSMEDSANAAKAKNYIPDDESVSIENQYELLSKFTMLNGWTEIKSYRDDGYSGGNFQRPGFLEMLEDARHGEINLILVKDLSRLGRDFVEVGRYTDVVFPALGCRFVSVLDSLDSEGDNTDMLHFRSLMNDYHLKDLSNKVKSVHQAKMRAGQFLSAYAPCGYRKNSENKYQLVIDEAAAAVVRRMFDMRRAGISYAGITAALNKDNILSPRWHWALHYGNGSCKYGKQWLYTTVHFILNNPVYLGQLRQNTTGMRSYKDATKIHKPESDWIIHEDAHEAIISREVWETVQEINRHSAERAMNRDLPEPYLFVSKLVCADCGSRFNANRMKLHLKDGTITKLVSYFCNRFITSGRSVCSGHRISEKHLVRIVLNEVKAHAQALVPDETSVMDKLSKHLAGQNADLLGDTREEIGRLHRRVDELERMTTKLYKDKVMGTIAADTFAVLMQKCEQEWQQKEEHLDVLQADIDRHEQNSINIQSWATMIRKCLNLRELDQATIDELIDHIEIGECSVVNGKRQQDVKIYYRFVGLVGDVDGK